MRRARRDNAAGRYECEACEASFRTADELAAHWTQEHYTESRRP